MSEKRDLLIESDFSEVASTPVGQRVLGNLLITCRYNASTLDSNSTIRTAFMEGMRSIALQIQEVLGPRKTCECIEAFQEFENRMEDADGSN